MDISIKSIKLRLQTLHVDHPEDPCWDGDNFPEHTTMIQVKGWDEEVGS